MTDEFKPAADDVPIGGKKKEPPTDRDRTTIEPVPANEELYRWLSGLFFGSDQFPERIEVRVVRGRDFATMGPKVHEVQCGKWKNKPTEPELVRMSNEFVHRMQRDCDISRKSVVYHVAAMHFERGSEPYDRWLYRCNPGATFRNGENGENEEDEDASMEKRFSVQTLKHLESMSEIQRSALEGMFEQLGRQLERLGRENDNLRARNEKLHDMLERSQSLEAERKERAEWMRLRREGVEKVFEVVGNVGLPMLQSAFAKKTPAQPAIPPSGTGPRTLPPEVTALQGLLRLKSEGGSAVEAEIDAAFGSYTPDGAYTPGVLSLPQAQIIWQVALEQLAVECIDPLLPGGPLEITQEQFMGLVKVFGMERLLALKVVIDNRMQARQARVAQAQQK